MRRVTEEERSLFLAALEGRLPPRKTQSHPKPSITTLPATSPVPAALPVPASGRNASDAEILQFLEAIGLRPAAVKPAPAKTSIRSAASKPPPVAKPATGLDGNTKRKLDKGEIAPTARLDLHGLTESAAHGTLMTFLVAAHRRGDRLVLVVTGKGEKGRGVLRRMVPRWIEEAPMAKIIAETRLAHRRHGGDGALYVYLRKAPR